MHQVLRLLLPRLGYYTALVRKIGLCCSLALFASTNLVSANDYPSKPVRIVVPYPAGSTADVVTRQMGAILAGRLKQPVVIDNRPGANGMVGAAAVANSPPDGYSLLFASTQMLALTPLVVDKLPLDPQRDLVPIILTASAPAIVVVNSSSSIRSVAELIAAAKKRPGQITFGTSGPGSPQHVMGELLSELAGIELLAVPYKGETPALQDLMAGQIDLAFGFPAGTLPFVRDERLRALAITSAQRNRAFSHLPTVAESGVPGYAETSSALYMAPRGTPPMLIERLNTEIRESLFAMREIIAERGGELVASTPQQAAAAIAADAQRYARLVKRLGMTPR
jgi:tripartite-type tricarboxylate transporter receptor subunit TctC